VASLEGQGASDGIAGLPIPIHAQGPWDSISYDIDYEAMFNAAVLDPELLANMPAAVLDQASQFGVTLPAIPGLSGGEGGGGGLAGALEGLLGGGTQKQQPEAQEGTTPSEEPKEEQPPLVQELGKQLKGLFN